MKNLLLIILTLITFACTNKQTDRKSINNNNSRFDTVIIHDTVFISNNKNDWQEGFGLTHEPDKDTIWYKPVNFYITDKECSGLSIDFYFGRLRPSDDYVTDELLKLAITDNKKLRPFYRWCLNKTIVIQDGALGEHTGIPARKYAEKFPKEFFEYMDIDTSGQKLIDWIGSISYSGFYDEDDYEKPKLIQHRMAQTMKLNCKNCDKKTINRIDIFTIDCFN